MGRPSSNRARDTRQEILEAALRLFAERGFHGTGMRVLASAVGLRESAIYHYFSSKNALLAEVLLAQETSGPKALEAELRSLLDQPLGQILTVLAERTVAELQSSRSQQLVRVVQGAGRALDKKGEGLPATDETRRIYGRLLQQLRKRGSIRGDVDLDTFHLHFLGPLVLATGTLGRSKPRLSSPLSRIVRQHVAFMEQALAPPHVRGRKARATKR